MLQALGRRDAGDGRRMKFSCSNCGLTKLQQFACELEPLDKELIGVAKLNVIKMVDAI